MIFYDNFTGKNQSTACRRDANAGHAAALPARKPLSIIRYYPFLGSEVWETSSHSCWIPVAGLMAPGSMNYMNNAAPMGAISKAVPYPFLETLRAIVYWICLTRELWSLADSHHSSIKGRCASATATAKRPWCCSHSHCLSRSFKLWRSCLVSNNSRRCRERLSGGALNLLLFWSLLLSELIFEVFLIVYSDVLCCQSWESYLQSSSLPLSCFFCQGTMAALRNMFVSIPMNGKSEFRAKHG